MLMRVATVMAGTNVVYTGPNWVLDTNNLLIASGGSSYDQATAAGFSTLQWTLAITNSAANRAYAVDCAPDPAGPWSTNAAAFYGALTSGELTQTVTVTNDGSHPYLYWRVRQIPGFVALGIGANRAQGMGQFLGCPGAYVGFIDFTNWPNTKRFYEVDTNYATHSVSDLYRATNHIQLFYPNGVDCAVGTASVSVSGDYTAWPSVYFYNNYPSNQTYRLLFQGFIEPAP